MSARQTAMLLGLAAVWGASFLFIAIAVDDLGALGVAFARCVGGAAALLAWAAATGRIGSLSAIRERWRDYVLLSALNAAIPFALIASAELTIPASLAAIVNATAPMFAAVIAIVWLGDRLDGRRGAGLALGLVGVALVVGLAPIGTSFTTFLAIAASLAAAASYSFGGHLIQRRFAGHDALTVAFGQQAIAAVLCLPFLFVDAPRRVPDLGAIAAVLALGVLSSGLAYLFYFVLIDELGATSALSVTYLVPVFGVLWAALFRDEHITGGMIVGAIVVLGGVILVTWKRRTVVVTE